MPITTADARRMDADKSWQALVNEIDMHRDYGALPNSSAVICVPDN